MNVYLRRGILLWKKVVARQKSIFPDLVVVVRCRASSASATPRGGREAQFYWAGPTTRLVFYGNNETCPDWVGWDELERGPKNAC